MRNARRPSLALLAVARPSLGAALRASGARCAVVALLLSLVPAALVSPLQGQSSDERAVGQVLDRVFAGMAEADSAKVRSAFAGGARFAMLPSQGGGPVRYQPVDGWLAAIAGSEGRWEERLYDVEIRVDDTMASAWTPYTFLLDGAVRHCGVNSIELLRTPDGWKITQLSDTRRTEGCPTGGGGGQG